MSELEHIPVLLSELIAGLAIKPNANYIDCTLGAGGHAKGVLELSSPEGKLYAFDLDSQAIDIAKKNLNDYSERVVYINSNYSSLEEAIKEYHIDMSKIKGVYIDLGLSSMQLNNKEKGFSFKFEAPLDMNFGEGSVLSAAEILNIWSEEEIGKIIRDYGEEKYWRLIASKIVKRRKTKPFVTTTELVDLIMSIKPRNALDRIHPATKTFQALRIAVNDELNNLKELLPRCIDLLPSRARLVIISFHSLEDRIVKNIFREMSTDCICPPNFPQCVCKHKASVKKVTSKPIIPTIDEINNNPRARSAKLKIVEKI